MRIAFFGSSLVSAYWNGAATYYRGIVRALHERGHRITFYEPDAYGRQQHRDIDDPDWAEVVVYEPSVRGAFAALERAQVMASLRRLPPRQREVLVLRYYADMSEAQIADALGISPGAVKSHASRGTAALRHTLEPLS